MSAIQFDVITGYSSVVDYIPSPNDNELESVTVPHSVSAYQAQMAMLDAGILADVEIAVRASGVQSDIIAWERASVWERESPTIAAIASALGMTDEQLDALFIQAATYRA